MVSEEASTPMLRIGHSAVPMATCSHQDDSPAFTNPDMTEACDSGVLSVQHEETPHTTQMGPLSLTENTTEPNKVLKQRIAELEEENSTLASKIRGYQTLGMLNCDSLSIQGCQLTCSWRENSTLVSSLEIDSPVYQTHKIEVIRII